MSREVLINNLRAKGAQQIAALWGEARAAADKSRTEAEQRLAGELDRCDLAGRQAIKAGQRRQTMAAQRQAEALITRAEQALSAHLLDLARTQLAGEWLGDRARPLLGRLAAELPPGEWSKIRVNPADAEPAGKLFPQAEIETDSQIPGGLAVTSRDGRVTIDNTWSTRLERIWSRLAPQLLREVAPDDAAG